MADRKIYFATDIHGSEVCVRKFLNAAKFYDCDTLIMGGDITGKMIVPIVSRGQGVHTATLYGRDIRVVDDGLSLSERTGLQCRRGSRQGGAALCRAQALPVENIHGSAALRPASSRPAAPAGRWRRLS